MIEVVLSLATGLALSAACGFRVFVPLWVLSAAALSGHITPYESFEWIGTWPAFAMFTAATVAEVAAFYIPWVDNALDTIASPAAVVAGIIVSASVFSDISPFLRWALAIIAGGGMAATVQGVTVSTRSLSSATTGGTANPVIATMEAAGSFISSILGLLLPVLALLLLTLVLAFWARRRWRRRRLAPTPA